MSKLIPWPEVIYSGIEFSFPQTSPLLIDDITHTISREVHWFSPRNVPAIFNVEDRKRHYYSIEPYPDTHHTDVGEL